MFDNNGQTLDVGTDLLRLYASSLAGHGLEQAAIVNKYILRDVCAALFYIITSIREQNDVM